jgi:GNAT superfamily N-acetyltransferase
MDPGSAPHHSAALHAAVHPGNARLIRPAQSEDDAGAIHRFLCAVAPPVLHCPVDHAKSLAEVRRVVLDRDYGFAYLALEGDRLVGTIGAIFVSWWYGEDHFFTDRWFFTLPGQRWAGPRLLAEADAIARAVGVPLIVNLKQRRTTAAVTFVQPVLLGDYHPTY